MNAKGRLEAANTALARLSGQSVERMAHVDILDFIAPSDHDEFLLAVKNATQGRPVELGLCLLSASGIHCVCNVILWENASKILAVFEADESNPVLSDVDTGAETAESFYGHLGMELYRSQRYHRPMTMIRCDISNLHEITSRFGEVVESKILALVGSTLRKQTRRTDVVARISHTGFALILPETSLAGGIAAAVKLSGSVENTTLETERGIVHPTVCFGVVGVSESSTPFPEPRAVIDTAEWALQTALQHGPGSVEAASTAAFRLAG